MEMPKSIEAALPKKPEPKSYGIMTIERRTLITSDATLSIENIARLTTNASHKSERTLVANAILFGLAPLFVLLALLQLPSQAAIILLCAAIVAALVAVCLPRKGESTYRLTVHTNDSGVYSFWAPEKSTIESVRRIITDKINDGNEASTYSINFEKGVIQNMGIGNVGSIGAIVNGDNNQVTAGAGNAKVNSGTINQRIDYATVLPTVTDWKAYFQRESQNEAMQRFDRLEQLLKSGTPTPASKSQLRQLLEDLSNAFSASGNALNLFTAIRTLAGL